MIFWRRGRDSNPRCVAAHLFSRQASSTAPAPLLNSYIMQLICAQANVAYNKHMDFVRKALLVLLTPLLPVLLFAIALDFGILRVVGSPAPVKHVLADSGIYNSVVSNALSQAQKSTGDSNGVSLENLQVKKAAESSFSPQVVQQSSEKVIDGIYNWLDGKTSQPNFNVNLTSVKASFAEKVGEAAKNNAATLPPCAPGVTPSSDDPFNASCLPRGVTPAQVGEQAKNEVLNAQGFLEHPNITASSIQGSNSNQDVFNNQLKDAPKQYQRVKKTPFILIILSALIIAAIIFLNTSKRKGLRHVGIVLLATGIFMLLFAWGLNRVVTHSVIPKMRFDNEVLQSSVRKLATNLTHSIDQNYWIFGGVYTILGLLTGSGAMFINKGNKNTAPVAAKPADSAPASKALPKPKTPPKVQG
jgi:hypothetical protein